MYVLLFKIDLIFLMYLEVRQDLSGTLEFDFVKGFCIFYHCFNF